MIKTETKSKRLRVAVLISGSGSNLEALIQATHHPNSKAEIALVVSNKNEAFGLTRAKRYGIKNMVLSPDTYENREAFDAAIDDVLRQEKIQFICLAGFMRRLSAEFVRKWSNRILNIHPSLLPAFPGLNTHRRAIDAGVRFSGCTVHLVREALDDGPIIVQAAVPVLQGDCPRSLAERILAREHQIYPMALQWIADGRLQIDGKRVILDKAASSPPPPALTWPV